MRLFNFKLQTWYNQVELSFLQLNGQFAPCVYSLILAASAEVAQEIYFRLQTVNQAFSKLATQHSHVPEAQTGGLISPVTAATSHFTLEKILTSDQPEQVRLPSGQSKWFVIISLHKFTSVLLDDPLRQQLLGKHIKEWLKLRLKSVAGSDDSITFSVQAS